MKRRVFLSFCFLVIVIGAFGIYSAVNWHNTVDTHSHPDASREQRATEAEPSAQQETVLTKEDTPAPNEHESSLVNTERAPVHTAVPEETNDYDWRTDAAASPTQTWQDPATDQKAQEIATHKSHLIDDPETMDPDELHSAHYEQLLEQHGDIPEVHIVMDYNRRWENNEPLTLEERIEGLTASFKLFPSESNRKTLDFYKWLQSKGATLENMPAMTPADIEDLRSKGISVKQTSTQDGVSLKISTK